MEKVLNFVLLPIALLMGIAMHVVGTPNKRILKRTIEE